MLLEVFKKDYPVFHPEFNFVFNSYYESVGKRVLRTDRGNLSRPSVEEVYRYRAHVDQYLLEFLDQNQELTSEVTKILEIGLQHEQQHQELLLYDIKYILGNNPLFPAYKKRTTPFESQEPSSLTFLSVDSGNYFIGHDGHEFSYDNELGRHQIFTHDYEIANRLITNGEYLEFIEDRGYKDFRHWYSEAWDWVDKEQRKAPLHWHQIGSEWHNYTLHGLEKVNANEPVAHVSQFEAAAFAKWKGMRLPTEFEWEIACCKYEPTIHDQTNFVEQQKLRPSAPNKDNFQFYGDLWEWTNSAYSPYPFYRSEEGALGEYNGKFMINQMVLRGGSYATPQDHIRPTYRNFFHPNLSWLFSGIRLARHV